MATCFWCGCYYDLGNGFGAAYCSQKCYEEEQASKRAKNAASALRAQQQAELAEIRQQEREAARKEREAEEKAAREEEERGEKASRA